MIKELIKIFIVTLFCVSCRTANIEPDYNFSNQRIYSNHREIDITWKNEGVNLSGTLYLPLDSGLYSTAVWIHGSSVNLRKTYKYINHHIVRQGSACNWTDRGYAFFSYDKRGSGESEGIYTTQVTEEYLKLLGRDALSAIKVCTKYPEINKNKIGFFGESQAGWTIPTIEDNDFVKFSIVINGPVISYGEFEYYASLTGNNDTKFQYTDCNGIDLDSVYSLMYEKRNSGVIYNGYNPEHDLIQMQQPCLFLIGLRDLHVPANLDLEELTDIKNNYGKNWEIVTFENADHALLTNNGLCLTLQDISLTLGVHYQVDWETPTFNWLISIENE